VIAPGVDADNLAGRNDQCPPGMPGLIAASVWIGRDGCRPKPRLLSVCGAGCWTIAEVTVALSKAVGGCPGAMPNPPTFQRFGNSPKGSGLQPRDSGMHHGQIGDRIRPDNASIHRAAIAPQGTNHTQAPSTHGHACSTRPMHRITPRTPGRAHGCAGRVAGNKITQTSGRAGQESKA